MLTFPHFSSKIMAMFYKFGGELFCDKLMNVFLIQNGICNITFTFLRKYFVFIVLALHWVSVLEFKRGQKREMYICATLPFSK